MKNTDEQSGPYKRGFYQGYSGDMDPNRSQLTGQDLTDFENGANAGGERREIEELGEEGARDLGYDSVADYNEKTGNK